MIKFVPPIWGLPLLALCMATRPVFAQTKPSIPTTAPNLALNLVHSKGNCPKQVNLWTSFRYYEGGGEHTVIADTRAIAKSPPVLVKSGPLFASYKIPLKPMYSSCFGQAISQEESQYRVRFEKGNAYFEVDLTSVNQPPSNPAEISYVAVLTARPYVRWAIAD